MDALEEQIKVQRQTIHADGYPMSIGELSNLYRDGELYLRPAFQRFFRWKIEQKSRLIESLLLGIPIPSIFVSQREDGSWEVIDGLQRLSSVFEFMGILKGPDGQVKPALVLEKTKYLSALEGKKWDSDGDDGLSEGQQRIIKRTPLDIKILKRESTPQTKYELFQRLNTGGSDLSEQEVRNCLVIMDKPDLFDTYESFSKIEEFVNTVSLSENALEQRYDLELISRWIVLRRTDAASASRIEDISSYVSDTLLAVFSEPGFDINQEKNVFEQVVKKIVGSLGDDAGFRKWDSTRGKFSGGFSIAAFEVLAVGLGMNPGKIADLPPATVITAAKDMWTEANLGGKVGMGVRASTRLGLTLKFGSERFGG